MIDNLIIIVKSLLNLLNSPLFILVLLILIITYHFILFFARDVSYIKALKKNKDPEVVRLEELNEVPLVNIIIPAWKEGKEAKLFENCLQSITKLNYPNLKIIVSAGGSEETIKIADSFKNYNNFTIIRQKPGGKMKALNDCIAHISKGIVYSIDAITENQYVTAGSVRPLTFQENIAIVKYILINRNTHFRIKFSRIGRVVLSGPNSCFKYEVIEKIGNFFDDELFLASDRFRGLLVFSKGFKIYWLTDYRGKIFTSFPDLLKNYVLQEFRWRKNSLTNPYLKNKVKIYIKFFLSFLISMYLFSSPFFIFFNTNLALIGLIMLLNKYFKKIRKIVFFKRTVNKKFYEKFGLLFYLKLVFFIIIDEILILYLGINLLITRSKKPKITIE